MKKKTENEFSDEWYEDENLERALKGVDDVMGLEDIKPFVNSGDRLIGECLLRESAIKEGGFPVAFSKFHEDDLLALLSVDTMAYAEQYCRMDDGSWEDGFTVSFETDATKIQQTFFAALREYVTTAASRARQLGSSSLDLWVQILDMTYIYSANNVLPAKVSHVSKEKAALILDLEARAAERLRLDIHIAALPDFKRPETKKAPRKPAKR